MESCKSCQSQIWKEDEEYFKFQDNIFCETCWLENVCHICGDISETTDYMYCEDCNKHLSPQCQCAVILTPQYHGVTCRLCFKEKTYFCDLCQIDLYNFVKTTTVSFCEENTYMNNDEYKGLICDACIIKKKMRGLNTCDKKVSQNFC
jgi:hypothetical protein